jgi:hypothetical protein
MEANGASSPKDFKNKIYICKKRVRRNEILAKNVKEKISTYSLNNKKITSRVLGIDINFPENCFYPKGERKAAVK